MNLKTIASLAMLAVCVPVVAGAAAPAAGDERVAIRAGHLLDVRSGQYRSPAYILVEHGRISAVGATAPSGVRVIDLSGKFVLPGIIDVHGHLASDYKDQSSASHMRTSGPQAALIGVGNARTYLREGVTTLRDAGETQASYPQFALRDAIRNGVIEGPRLVCAGMLISLSGGHTDDDTTAPDFGMPRRPNIADTVDEMRIAVRRDLKYGADWIKLMASGGVIDPFSDFRTQELSEEQMAAAVELAHRAGRRVMAHAEGAAGIKAAVRAGVDTIEHGTMLDEEGATLMAARGTWLVPTLQTFQVGLEPGEEHGLDPVSMAKARDILKYQQPAFTLALKHHLNIAFGDDGDAEIAIGEFNALVRGGLTPLEAIQAATINGARLLGLESEIGAIEAGKSADIIAVDADPLASIDAMHKVSFVMQAGRVARQ